MAASARGNRHARGDAGASRWNASTRGAPSPSHSVMTSQASSSVRRTRIDAGRREGCTRRPHEPDAAARGVGARAAARERARGCARSTADVRARRAPRRWLHAAGGQEEAPRVQGRRVPGERVPLRRHDVHGHLLRRLGVQSPRQRGRRLGEVHAAPLICDEWPARSPSPWASSSPTRSHDSIACRTARRAARSHRVCGRRRGADDSGLISGSRVRGIPPLGGAIAGVRPRRL